MTKRQVKKLIRKDYNPAIVLRRYFTKRELCAAPVQHD